MADSVYLTNPFGGGGSGGITIGTTTITGGTDTRVLYDNAGVVGEYAVTGTGTTAVLSTAPTLTGPVTVTGAVGSSALTITGGTQTADNPALNLTQTWNNAGVTFTGVKLNVTDTASAALSLLADFQVGGVSKLALAKHGGFIASSGSQTQPNFQFGNSALFYEASGSIWLRGGTSNFIQVVESSTSGSGVLGFSNNGDTFLRRDSVANTVAQANGTNAQSFNHYGRDVSTSNRNYLAIRHAVSTQASVSGASVTATGLIPAGAIVLGISTRVTVALGTGSGTTGYQVGDGSDADRWGTVTGTAAGTKTTNANWTTTTVPVFTSAQNVVVTANGGNFNGTGTIVIDVSYAFGDAD